MNLFAYNSYDDPDMIEAVYQEWVTAEFPSGGWIVAAYAPTALPIEILEHMGCEIPMAVGWNCQFIPYGSDLALLGRTVMWYADWAISTMVIDLECADALWGIADERGEHPGADEDEVGDIFEVQPYERP